MATSGCSHNGDTGSSAKPGGVHVPENFCSLLSAAEISRVMGSAFPAAEGSQSPSEAQCTSIPTAGNDVSFKLYRNNEYCIDDKPPDKECFDSQSKGFLANKQSAGEVQNIPGLGDQAFCFVAPPATVDVLKGWIYLIVGAGTCVQAQTLAAMLLAKISA
ncbi:MAG TPA: hypothetical protein VGG53_02740 [Mycobacterium sp.]|uniref:hypothetical protein n=1 Tax=Mycobacterium sp. TaxID=1785 RepID=UPI002F4166BE